MTRVVAAIDNSAAARAVLVVGRAVAAALGADLDAVHVLEDGAETATASAAAASLTLRILSGVPAEVLTEEADRADVVAVVFGLRDRAAGPRPAGHLVLEVAGHTATPVVAVPPGIDPPDRVSTLLVAMEGSTTSSEALGRTLALSAGAGLDLVVVHVDEEVPPFTDQVQHESDAYLQEFVARHGRALRDVRIELRIGAPSDELLAAIETIGPQLVAVGWPHPGGPDRGEVAREILAHCPVPLLLVPVP
jgi:nucleotide-binding universal stress UspA family protein